MTQRVGFVFPRPPKEYDQAYFERLINLLNHMEQRLHNLGDVGMDSFHLRECPSEGGGLRAGDVFEDNGFLKIVLSNDIYVSSMSMTSYLGTITVSTS